MTEVLREAREGNEPGTAALPREAESAQRATSITRTDSVAFQMVTQSARATFRAAMAGVAAIDRAGSLPDAQPPTLRQARAWHHRCAGHYEALILRWPRLLWGYVHLLIVKPALNAAEWVTASPARSAVAAAVFLAFWFGR